MALLNGKVPWLLSAVIAGAASVAIWQAAHDEPGRAAQAGAVFYDTTKTASQGIKILAPDSGQVCHIGDTLAIVWIIDTLKGYHQVIPSISTDDGLLWNDLPTSDVSGIAIGSSYYNGRIGTYKWKIPDSIPQWNQALFKHTNATTVSDSCLVKIEESYHSHSNLALGRGISQHCFSIKPGANAIRPSVFSGRSFDKPAIMATQPNAGQLRISIGCKGNHIVKIVNVAGKKVMSLAGYGPQEYNFSIRNSNLSHGMYLLSVQAGAEKYAGIFLLR
jgi:hypothetical protein